MLVITPTEWGLTLGLILVLFLFDLVVSGRRPHAVGFREAVFWSVFYIGAAIAFGIAFGQLKGWDYGGEYFAGYLVEKSLSVDNLFVFVIIFATFAVPEKHQHRILTFGIVLALVLRAIFIALGAALLAAFSFMFLVFGLVLIVTAVKLFQHRDQDPTVEDNGLVRLTRRVLPVTDDYDEGRLTTKLNGRRVFTPMFVVLVAVGSTDLLFALDSIPAVFGVTESAYIVFVANAFALLGLRALFFLVQGLLDRLVYLSTGLALILAFIGLKLILHWGHKAIDPAVPEIPTSVSLVVIGVILVITTLASLAKTKSDPSLKAHAGSLRAHPDQTSPPSTG